MKHPQVTILIPNYKTPELTKLCLRLIRKHTCHGQAEVIVIDNESRDASIEYLRSLSWIKLIERKAVPGEGAISAHSRALDLGLEQVSTPYVLSIHTDTLIKHPHWLNFLISHMEKKTAIAGVGSWKLEAKPMWRQVLKKLERNAQLAYYRLLRQNPQAIEGVGKNYYYLRSHCAMYRMDLIRRLNLSFSGGDMVAGKDMHKRLVDSGHEMVFLSSEVLVKYLDHINHATTVLNPELSTRTKSVEKGLRRIRNSLARLNAESILSDSRLDL
ncbi:hypothetical protein AQUSIP_16370 [Aquicella siphonis]|uniref:Glycosyltransferase 2-like domain-containing protein n=1 Tax=Aquicella siphonis TaxID=254247 RepID=A0A5E4PJ48_9COXI|nr:glycosyltransferase family 2 protein [Aquicella siphonis]VVC76326.1 hypothetical protein AQUSIP_16370 [Aquicella siphonis]